MWRVGRKIYLWARREASQGPESNGEYWLLAQVVHGTTMCEPLLLDIGARIGDWSDCARTLFKTEHRSGLVEAFEPSAETYAHLKGRFESCESVHTNRLALSDQTGTRDFYVVGKLAGVNTLTPVKGASVEQVPTRMLDEYLVQQKIDRVVMVKSDVEGHDLSVLLGATELFLRGGVDVWQFEYNHRWLATKSQLKDVFNFIANKPYRFGKLYQNGIETYKLWHPELERFFEANYVLIRQGSEFERLCTPVRFNRHNVLEHDPIVTNLLSDE